MTKLCVFDFDGTLINTIYDIAACMNFALSKMGKTTYDVDAYYHMVGNGVDIFARRALPDGTEEEIALLKELYKEKYLKDSCVFSKVYEGVQELLEGLQKRGIHVGIISNKPQEQIDLILKEVLEFDAFFEVIGQDGRFPIKPAPDALHYLMEKTNVDKDEVWYIGDSDVDILFGKAADVGTIGAAWGFRGEEELASVGATKIAYQALDILDMV